MLTLKPHITAMKRPLSSALAAIFHALHHPDTLVCESTPDSLQSGLDRLADSGTKLVQAIKALNHDVFQVAACGASTWVSLSIHFTQAVQEMVAAYAGSLSLIKAVPGQPSIALERAARANLERLAMWLSDVLTTLVDPERLRHEALATENWYERNHKLHLRFPDSVAELEYWVETPTGYDAGLVRDTLVAARDMPAGHLDGLPCGNQPPATLPTTPARKSGMGFLATVGAVFLGVALFDGLFGDDGDGDA